MHVTEHSFEIILFLLLAVLTGSLVLLHLLVHGGVVGSASAPSGSSENATVFFLRFLREGSNKGSSDAIMVDSDMSGGHARTTSDSARKPTRHFPVDVDTLVNDDLDLHSFISSSCSLGPKALGAAPTTARNMATLREIELRLKSVRNIEKITKSMKMIASTKMNKAQRAMQAGKEYGLANSELFQHAPAEEAGKRTLFIVVSSDKGLCGGIHSSVTKATRRAFAEKDKVAEDSPVMVIGDKSKAQLSRLLPKNLVMSFNQIGRDIPTFADAAGVADLILTSGVQYDKIAIVYNKFVSAISYEAAIIEVESEAMLKESPGFKAYEMEDDVTKDLSEFSLANAIYAALVEAHACEQSARRNAMDNASKNAGDMINRLTLQYNRGRQAAITNELVDIITGLDTGVPDL
ncbi:hypothetical protein ACG7TL_002100 [Trametes sanguinea]